MGTTRTDHAYATSTKGAVVSGTITFAGVMLATLAVFGILQGIAAIASDQVYVEGIAYTYELDVTTWGWVHLVIGVAALGTGIGLATGKVWAMVLGLVIALLSALANFAFMPYYPLWSLVVIAFDVFVMWALCQEISHRQAV